MLNFHISQKSLCFSGSGEKYGATIKAIMARLAPVAINQGRSNRRRKQKGFSQLPLQLSKHQCPEEQVAQ